MLLVIADVSSRARGRTRDRTEPWNHAFAGGPVERAGSDVAAPTITLAHDLRRTVLGPTRERLEQLQPKWRDEVAAALTKNKLDPEDVSPDLIPDDLEPMGRKKPRAPRVGTKAALRELAGSKFTGDKTKANGSSIALLLEYRGVRLVLAGDAHAPDLVSALSLVERPDRYTELPITAFKLPHHGSRNNVSSELVAAVQCRHWLISTNGVKHYHLDASAIARILVGATTPVLHFNEPSTYNGWWNNDAWRATHGYETVYGDASDGLALRFAADGSVLSGREFLQRSATRGGGEPKLATSSWLPMASSRATTGDGGGTVSRGRPSVARMGVGSQAQLESSSSWVRDLIVAFGACSRATML